MGLPTRGGYRGLRRVVRQRAVAHDIERPDQEQAGRFGESEDVSTTTVADVELYLFEPGEVAVGTEYGDRLEGSLRGLALPSEDVQHDDRVDYGSHTYEVDDVVHVPNAGDQQLTLFSLTRQTNTRD